jgi:NAD-dependent DNA ligase
MTLLTTCAIAALFSERIMIDNAQIAMKNRAHNRAVELLLGIVTGLIADQQLQDSEIVFLENWLAEHPDVAEVWPGSVIAATIRETLADGIVSDDERAHLLKLLQDMAVTDFATAGPAAAEVLQLPIKDDVPVDLRDQHVCHSGEFMFGTRTKCEQPTVKAGGWPVSTISHKVAYLVTGTNVSPSWAHTSYGRKMEQAVALQANGHPIQIISERRWLEVLAEA